MAKDAQITIDLSGILAKLREQHASDPEMIAKLDAFESREDRASKTLTAILCAVKPDDET